MTRFDEVFCTLGDLLDLEYVLGRLNRPLTGLFLRDLGLEYVLGRLSLLRPLAGLLFAIYYLGHLELDREVADVPLACELPFEDVGADQPPVPDVEDLVALSALLALGPGERVVVATLGLVPRDGEDGGGAACRT